MSFKETIAAERRLALMQLLRRVDGHANAGVLLESARQMGFAQATEADITGDLDFLRDCGAITDEWFGGTVRVASLTRRGLDIVDGRVKVDGIKAPPLVTL